MPGIFHVNWRVRVTLAIVLAMALTCLSFLSTLALAVAPAVTPVQISSDPFTNKSSQHKTQVEPDTFSYGSTVVAAFQSGRFSDGGSSDIGWATSTDNGQTWTHGFLPGTTVFSTPKGKYKRITDPAVAYDAKHSTWLIQSLALNGGENGGGNIGRAILVSLSHNGGLKWTKPYYVAKATQSQYFDKGWIACDNTSSSPYYGHCYVQWDQVTAGDLIYMSTSTDGGKSWGPIKTTADNAAGLGGQPVVQPNGTVVVPYAGSGIDAFTSTNGGKSWGKSVQIAVPNSAPIPGNMRNFLLPSAEIDGAGHVFVTWYDCSFENNCSTNDLVISSSANGNQWSAVQRIPTDPLGSGVSDFLPGIAVDKSTSGNSAHIAVTYYFFPNANCNQSTCQLEIGFISSTNGGQSWSAKTVVTQSPMKTSWLANTNLGYMIGDYISTSISGGKAFPGVLIATAPAGSVLNEEMYTVQGGLLVSGGAFTSAGEQVFFTGSRHERWPIAN